MNKLVLPGLYTEKVWKRGGSNPKHEKFIGKNYVSWSILANLLMINQVLIRVY